MWAQALALFLVVFLFEHQRAVEREKETVQYTKVNCGRLEKALIQMDTHSILLRLKVFSYSEVIGLIASSAWIGKHLIWRQASVCSTEIANNISRQTKAHWQKRDRWIQNKCGFFLVGAYVTNVFNFRASIEHDSLLALLECTAEKVSFLSLSTFFLLWQLCLSGFFSIYFLQFSHNTAPSEDWLPRALTHGPFFLVPSAWSGSSSHALKVICWLQLLVKLFRPWQPALLLTERSCQTGWLFQLSQPICSKWRRRRRKSGLCVVGLFFNSKKPSFLFC